MNSAYLETIDMPKKAMKSQPESDSRMDGQPFPALGNIRADDKIFLTGATGFLGGSIATDLLNAGCPATLLFLVRARTSEDGLVRVRESLAKFRVSQEILSSLTTDNVICGDLTSVAAFSEDPRLDTVSYVINCAGMTSFGKTPNIRSINVDGTLELVRRIGRMFALRRFIHVSTAMICGSRPPHLVHEDYLPDSSDHHLVPYTASKSDAERLIHKAMAGKPYAIVRPTIIVGHTRLGCEPSGSIFWAFRMGDALNATVAGPKGRIDVVPVDYVSAAILHLLAKQDLSHIVYHIGSGENRSCNFKEISDAFGKVIGTEGKEIEHMSVEEACKRKDEYPELFGPCNKRFMQGAVRIYGGFASLDSVFDISRLVAEGAPLPPKFSSYLEVCALSSAHMTIAEQCMTDFL